jgi:hypothetical protein
MEIVLNGLINHFVRGSFKNLSKEAAYIFIAEIS